MADNPLGDRAHQESGGRALAAAADDDEVKAPRVGDDGGAERAEKPARDNAPPGPDLPAGR